MGHYHWYCKNKKEYEEVLWTMCASKLDNWNVMYKFLEIHKLSKLNQERIDNLNIPMVSIEIWIRNPKNHPQGKNPGLDSFTSIFSETFKELIPIVHKLSWDTEGEETLPS